jgi:LysR family transcriptional regulator, glycine cleavage system transcriptional activator
MKDLPLHALRALAAVHDHGGVRAAALALGVVHSSVSRHLAELERWLGVALVEPDGSSRRFSLSRQGQELARVCSQAMRSMQEGANVVSEAKSRRSVTVATAPSLATRWLLPSLATQAKLLHGIEVSVIVEQRVVPLAESGADLAIRMGNGPWSDGECEPLMSDALYPVMSPVLLEQYRVNTLGRLLSMPLLHDRDPNAAWARWRDAHGPPSLDVRRGVRLGSSDLVLRAAALGQGVALARHRLVLDDLASGTLVRPFGDLRVELRDAYWLVRPTRFPPEAAALVLALKRSAAAS